MEVELIDLLLENLPTCSIALLKILPCARYEPPFNQPPPDLITIRGDGQKFEIGRGTSCQLIINCLQISRKHCSIQFKNGKWWIEDFSTNDVLVNNIRLVKRQPYEITNNDVLHLIPGGVLSYTFEYNNAVESPSPFRHQELTTPLIPTQPSSSSSLAPSAPVPRQNDDGNISDESESLLSLENDDEIFFLAANGINAGLVLNENNLNLMQLIDIQPPDNSVKDAKPTSLKRNADVLRPHNQISPRKSKNDRDRWDSVPSPRTTSEPRYVTFPEHEPEEELLDLEDVVPRPPLRKQPKTELLSPTKSPVRLPTNSAYTCSCSSGTGKPSSSTSPIKTKDQSTTADALDNEVLSKQLKHFTEQCNTLKYEKKLLTLETQIEKTRHQEELTQVKISTEAERMNLFSNFNNILESELNCCICNELYIQPTFIDCGHTFCNHCITEWILKKKDCPICRTNITKHSKQVELNNFLVKINSLFPAEMQQRRESLLKEREEEISVAKAVQAAELEERQRANAAAAAAAPGPGNLNRLTAQDLRDFQIANFGDILGGALNAMGDEVFQNVLFNPTLARPVPTARRTSGRVRVRRGAAAQVANAPAPANVPRQRQVAQRGRRGGRGAAVRVASPDLIILDESQVVD